MGGDQVGEQASHVGVGLPENRRMRGSHDQGSMDSPTDAERNDEPSLSLNNGEGVRQLATEHLGKRGPRRRD